MFGFKKGNGDAPPDIGAEEEYDAANSENNEFGGDSSSESDAVSPLNKIPKNVSAAPVSAAPNAVSGVVSAGASDFQLEKINSRLDSVVEWIKQFYDRFSYVNESIGELRNMASSNEKSIVKAMAEADKVIDIVKEVKPQELKMEYQKINLKVATLVEKIEGNAQIMKEVMKEMDDFRRKSEAFVGTEGLMSLNEDTKKDLINMQKVNSRVKMQADKVQEIFMELRSGFAESQKIAATVGNFEESYSGLKAEIEKLKLDYSKVIGKKEYIDFKKTYENKLTAVEGLAADVQRLKDSIGDMNKLVEMSLSASRVNKEDISKIALKTGAGGVKGVEEYENQIMDIVDVIGTLSDQVNLLKKKVNTKEVRVKAATKNVAKVPKLKPRSSLAKERLLAKKIDSSLDKLRKKIAGSGEGLEVKNPIKKKVVTPIKKKVVVPVRKKEAVVEDVEALKEEDAPLFDV